MGINSNSHFAAIPRTGMPRARFLRAHTHKTTFNVADLVPIMVDEVLPGDTYKLRTSFVLRMSTPIKPVMDNSYMDIHAFFVPNRIIWSYWESMNGENNESAWFDPTYLQGYVPLTYMCVDASNPDNIGFPFKSIADYMGIPPQIGYNGSPFSNSDYTPGNSYDQAVNRLPFHAYTSIWNHWYRDQNLQAPYPIDTEVGIYSTYPLISGWTAASANPLYAPSTGFGPLLKSCKLHDYFTSCLPDTQKGPAVTVPVGGSVGLVPSSDGTHPNPYSSFGGFPVTAAPASVTSDMSQYIQSAAGSLFNAPLRNTTVNSTLGIGTGQGCYYSLTPSSSILGASSGVLVNPANSGGSPVAPSNLVGFTQNLAVAASNIQITINNLRLAIQTQLAFEKDARGGTRYKEMLYSHFGVTVADARVQWPEFLGGKRVPINMAQVLQTSESATTPQGNTAAFSLTTGRESLFYKSFVEHGFVLVMATVRQDHSYQQGIEKFWLRRRRFDFFYPVFTNLGESPVWAQEIYTEADAATGSGGEGIVFGYQEYGADYRYKPSRISGEFRSTYPQPLDVWHYGDFYTGQPQLNSDWIQETPLFVDRTLSVSYTVSDQIQADFLFLLDCTRVMTLYSVPGRMDHYL